MTHICKKCGCELDENVKFCPNCGLEQAKDLPKRKNHTDSLQSEEIPLQIILRKIGNHKILSITIILLVVLSIGGYYGYQKYVEKQAVQEKIEGEVKHLLDIVGTYTSNSGIKLELRSDGLASIRTNKGIRYSGYWREKSAGYPIELSFSESFEIQIGSETHSYCSSLYFSDNTLWYDMDASRSMDYDKCTFLTKENK